MMVLLLAIPTVLALPSTVGLPEAPARDEIDARLNQLEAMAVDQKAKAAPSEAQRDEYDKAQKEKFDKAISLSNFNAVAKVAGEVAAFKIKVKVFGSKDGATYKTWTECGLKDKRKACLKTISMARKMAEEADQRKHDCDKHKGACMSSNSGCLPAGCGCSNSPVEWWCATGSSCHTPNYAVLAQMPQAVPGLNAVTEALNVFSDKICLANTWATMISDAGGLILVAALLMFAFPEAISGLASAVLEDCVLELLGETVAPLAIELVWSGVSSVFWHKDASEEFKQGLIADMQARTQA